MEMKDEDGGMLVICEKERTWKDSVERADE
jgi:hypothetical protein